MSESVTDILTRLVPDEVDALLSRILGGAFRRRGDGGRFRIQAIGAFRGYLTESLVALAAHPRLEVALVVLDEESERVLHFHEGKIVAATSNVLFERIGRLLYENGVVTHDDANTLVRQEEREGVTGVIGWIPDDVLRWAIERRAGEIVAALAYVTRGAFLLVEGDAPLQGIPATAHDPVALAARARRLYDAWRQGTDSGNEGDEGVPDAASATETAPAPLQGPLQPPRSREEEIQDILRRVREADIRLGEGE